MCSSIIIYTCPKCGGDLLEEVICTYPPTHKTFCPSCGWKYEEMDKIQRIPFETNDLAIHIDINQSHDYCKNCSSNPANGGNGICNCILGTSIVTC